MPADINHILQKTFEINLRQMFDLFNSLLENKKNFYLLRHRPGSQFECIFDFINAKLWRENVMSHCNLIISKLFQRDLINIFGNDLFRFWNGGRIVAFL